MPFFIQIPSRPLSCLVVFFSVCVAVYYCPSTGSVCTALLSLLTLANVRASVCVAVCRVVLAVYYTYLLALASRGSRGAARFQFINMYVALQYFAGMKML